MGIDKNGADYFKYQKQWFDFMEVTEENVTAKHTSLYLWIVQLANRLHWPGVIGLPTETTKFMAKIGSYKWYKKTLDDLIRWGFIRLIRRSYNQHSCNEVALVLSIKAGSKQVPKQLPHTKTYKDSLKTTKESVEEKILPHPSLFEIESIIKEKGLVTNAVSFFNHYESIGWKTGGGLQIVDWVARLIAWNETDKKNGRAQNLSGSTAAAGYKYKTYDQIKKMAETDLDVWKQYKAVELPDLPNKVKVWVHVSDIAINNLTDYVVKQKS